MCVCPPRAFWSILQHPCVNPQCTWSIEAKGIQDPHVSSACPTKNFGILLVPVAFIVHRPHALRGKGTFCVQMIIPVQINSPNLLRLSFKQQSNGWMSALTVWTKTTKQMLLELESSWSHQSRHLFTKHISKWRKCPTQLQRLSFFNCLLTILIVTDKLQLLDEEGVETFQNFLRVPPCRHAITCPRTFQESGNFFCFSCGNSWL